MANSKKMGEIHKGMDLPSTSKEADAKLFAVVEKVKSTIENNSGIHLEHRRMVRDTEVDKNGDANKRYGIIPDGGVLVWSIDDFDLPLLVAENKYQGTGQISMGNVVGRLAETNSVIQYWTRNIKINPLIAFCYGPDFYQGSYIVCSRLNRMNHRLPLNKVHVHKPPSGYGGQSIFYQTEPFADSVLYQNCLEVASISVRYYQENMSRVLSMFNAELDEHKFR